MAILLLLDLSALPRIPQVMRATSCRVALSARAMASPSGRLGGKPGDPGDPDRNQGGKPDLVGGGGSLPIFLGVLDSSFW